MSRGINPRVHKPITNLSYHTLLFTRSFQNLLIWHHFLYISAYIPARKGLKASGVKGQFVVGKLLFPVKVSLHVSNKICQTRFVDCIANVTSLSRYSTLMWYACKYHINNFQGSQNIPLPNMETYWLIRFKKHFLCWYTGAGCSKMGYCYPLDSDFSSAVKMFKKP